MSEFPKWLLALTGLSLIPLLICPVYLFGAQPFGTSDSAFVRFLLYMATQLLWFLPIIGFFTSLNAWRCGYNKHSIAIAIISLLISIGGIVTVFG